MLSAAHPSTIAVSVTIVQPATGNPFGIGFTVQAATDLIGPLEPGSFWRLELTAPANEEQLAVFIRPFISPALQQAMFNGSQAGTSIPWELPALVDGDAGQLRVQVVEPTFGVADEEVVAIVLDRNTGQAAALSQILHEQVAGIPAGLNEEEHNAVLQTNVGVIAMAGFDPLQLVGALASAIASSPPLGIGSLSGTYTLTGDGELPDLHAPFQDRLGVYWVATVIPAGLGHLHGQTEEFLNRLVQWRTVHVVGGVEMVTEVFDANWHGGLWRWATKLPEHVEYSILPGVTIQAQYWQFP